VLLYNTKTRFLNAKCSIFVRPFTRQNLPGTNAEKRIENAEMLQTATYYFYSNHLTPRRDITNIPKFLHV
jgi:hypothetical protein